MPNPASPSSRRQQRPEPSRSRGKGWVRRIAHGRMVSSKFFKRHLFITGMIVFLSIGLISVRFDCANKMENIGKLNRRIEHMRTLKQTERSRYMTLTRESAMQRMVDTLHLGLAVKDRPPYVMSYDAE